MAFLREVVSSLILVVVVMVVFPFVVVNVMINLLSHDHTVNLKKKIV